MFPVSVYKQYYAKLIFQTMLLKFIKQKKENVADIVLLALLLLSPVNLTLADAR